MKSKSIVQNDHVVLLSEKLKELIAKAPNNWAEQVATKMNISVSSVRSIVNGSRRVKDNILRLQIAKHLAKIIESEKKEIEKIIAL